MRQGQIKKKIFNVFNPKEAFPSMARARSSAMKCVAASGS
jgi:hypothetical protein